MITGCALFADYDRQIARYGRGCIDDPCLEYTSEYIHPNPFAIRRHTLVRIAIYGKGGIGKSTMSANITASLTDMGLKVLQIGCDPKHDSTRLLLDGREPMTILDYMRTTPVAERRLSDVIHEGYGGCLCAEAGGPEPGVGCAGRGIISSFDLLRDLGIDGVEKDVVLYDVLGDVVCGGFAVPIRNEYAEAIYIVSSGEFMSIYAANNILKGVSNYNPDRIGGIIFNSRGGSEEKERIERFSEAVGIPIVAEFDRSPLFSESEQAGRPLVDMFRGTETACAFNTICENILHGRRCRAKPLSESDLERCVLGREVVERDPRAEVGRAVADADAKPVRRYSSRNVVCDEIYHGCAFSGAQSVCASVRGLATVLHSPRSCAQFSFQMVSSSARRAHCHGTLPIAGYLDPTVVCTDMAERDMVFGGTGSLEKRIEDVISSGCRDVAVITSCPSGIIGDDVRTAVARVESAHPDARIALIEEDGVINGDFMQGCIDSGIELSRRFSRGCVKTDSVDLVGTKTISTTCVETIERVTSLLESIGVSVNCLYPGCSDIGEIERIGSARYALRLNPDRFADQLCQQLQDDFDVQPIGNVVRPGMRGLRAWLGEVAERFGRIREFDALMSSVEREYESYMETVPKILSGMRYGVVSFSKDIDWLLEGAESLGMVLSKAVIVNRSDYSNDLGLADTYDNVMIVDASRLEAESADVISSEPDIVFTTSMMRADVKQMAIPMVPNDDPFFAVDYFTRAARLMMSPDEPGWRRDVVRP